MRYLGFCVLNLSLLLLAPHTYAQQLILQSFGPLKNDGRTYTEKSILLASGRMRDPNDHSIKTEYTNLTDRIFVEVTVSEHANTTWVTHELEGQFRTSQGFPELVTLAGSGATRRFEDVSPTTLNPGGDVVWLSDGGTVIEVEYEWAGTGRTPEVPTDIVNAYLALYPSSLPESIVDTPAHHTQWIRDEMRRIFEYAFRDLGIARTASSATERSYREGEVEHWLELLADFRERFYGVGGGNQFRFDLGAAKLEHLKPGGAAAEDVPRHLAWLEQQLNDFQTWWNAHQNDPVRLPTPGVPTPPPPTIRFPPLPPEAQKLREALEGALATRTPTPP